MPRSKRLYRNVGQAFGLDGAIIVSLSFKPLKNLNERIDDALAAGFENRPLPI